MISKQDFIAVLDHIQKYRSLENKFCDLLEAMSDDSSTCDAFVYSAYESILVRTLEGAMDIGRNADGEVFDDSIAWWIYDTDFGREKQLCKFTVTEPDGTEVEHEILTASDLYDYLYNKFRIDRGI